MSDFEGDPEVTDVAALDTGAAGPGAVRLAAMDLLARREHSLRELRRKLHKRFPDQELVEGALQQLADEGLQSDYRFAEGFLRQRIARGYGPLRMRYELRERGIGDEEMRLALDAAEVDWAALAGELHDRKFGPGPAGDIREKARRARFLQYRGFSPEHFKHLL